MTTVTVPALEKWITANASTNRHWRHRHGLVSAWREAAALHARHAKPVRSPFAVEATIHRPDRRIYDLDGATTVKACIDGLRDAGVIAGDDTRHMRRYAVEAGEPDKVHPRIVLTITPLPVEGQTERNRPATAPRSAPRARSGVETGNRASDDPQPRRTAQRVETLDITKAPREVPDA